MPESTLLDSIQRARKAADAVRVGTEKAREAAALDPENAPQVILAKAATKIVLDSVPMDNPAVKEALIRKAGKIAEEYVAGTKPLPTPAGDLSANKREK